MKSLKAVSCVVLTMAAFAASGAIAPISLESVANASRLDEVAADGKGGWLDLGSNDLRVLPAGRQTVAKISFDIPACTGENHRTCLVLGRKGKEKAELKLPAGVRGQRLYLLHAIAEGPAPQKREIVAKLDVEYRGGGEVERRLRTGRDVAEWTSGRSFSNAAHGWTMYNRTTQVSLFVSSFELDEKRDVKEIEFKAEGNCPWMVLAVSIGDKVDPKGLVEKKPLKGTFRAPPPRTSPLKAFPAGQTPKNVILIIGDGMGLAALRLTSLYQYGRDEALLTHQFPFAGLCTTYSASSPVTDSAASGTAIATGTKTSNGTLGLRISSPEERKNPKPLVSVAEKAHAAGKAVALVTNDRCTGATPAAFYAHVVGRGETAKIAEQACASGYEVILGQGDEGPFLPESAGGKRKDDRNILDEMARAGYAHADTLEAFESVPATRKVLGLIKNLGGEERLGRAVKTALKHVGDAPKGFFMMAECATTDGGGHGNNPSTTVQGVTMLEWMVKEAVDFAESRGDTLVVVTADHETGGLIVTRGTGGNISYLYTSTSHTGTPVALYACGPGAERFGRDMDNTDIAKNFLSLWGLKED